MRKILALFGAIVMILGLSLVAFADDPATLSCTASTTQWCPGTEPEITLTVSLQNAAVAKSMALTFGIGDQFNVVSGAWSRSDAFMANFDPEKLTAAMAFTSETNINGEVFVLKLQAKSTAAVGDATITVTPTIKNGSVDIDCEAASVTLTVGHTGGEATCVAKAVCTTCHTEYGEVNANNHKNPEIRDAKAATCCEDGYTGDTWCTDCNTKIADGTVQTKTGAHVDADGKWESDGTQHWHTCYFGTMFDAADHTGGAATCSALAKCDICGAGYGEFDQNVHSVKDWTVTKKATVDAKGEQTGYCEWCGEKFTADIEKLESEIIDDGNGAEVEPDEDTYLPANIQLVVNTEVLSSAQETKVLDTVLDAVKDGIAKGKKVKKTALVCVLDISLWIDNYAGAAYLGKQEYHFDGSVTVTVPMTAAMKAAKNLLLVHIKDNDACEYVPFTRTSNDTVMFTVTGFSRFVFVDVTASSTSAAAAGAIAYELSSYKIKVAEDIKNGKILLGTNMMVPGNAVRVTVLPNGGYKLDTLTVTDAKGNVLQTVAIDSDAYNFMMPKSNVTVAATFVSVNAVNSIEKFTDCDPAAWYGVGVRYCVDKGYMVGTTEDKFSPDGAFSRAMIVTMLWRMEGSPAVNYAMSFADVANGQWYTEAIRWAQSTGLVKGMSETSFCPNDNITREQLATIFANYAKMKGISVTADNDLAKFTDTDQISTWALDNLKWANAVGLVNGRTETTIAPRGNATRAEAAVIVQRFCENIAK